MAPRLALGASQRSPQVPCQGSSSSSSSCFWPWHVNPMSPCVRLAWLWSPHLAGGTCLPDRGIHLLLPLLHPPSTAFKPSATSHVVHGAHTRHAHHRTRTSHTQQLMRHTSPRLAAGARKPGGCWRHRHPRHRGPQWPDLGGQPCQVPEEPHSGGAARPSSR